MKSGRDNDEDADNDYLEPWASSEEEDLTETE